MEQYTVTGMSCAACSTRVEKAVKKVPGVSECFVSLLTNSMSVSGDADEEEIIEAVKKAGYTAYKKGNNKKNEENDDTDVLKDSQTPALKRRLFLSLGFVVLLMYVSMGHTMYGFPMPSFFENNYVATGLLQMLLSLIVMLINKKFFINGFGGLINKAPNMDTLVALGSGASFIYSLWVLFSLTKVVANGESLLVQMHYMHEFYFESAAMILALITVGKMLEAYSKGKTTDALKSLIKLAPKTAIVLIEGKETEIDIKDIKKGDIFIVKAGASVPVDAIIIEGNCAIDESSLTGESIPVDKGVDDEVWQGTINNFGYVKCRATKVGEDTTLSQIIKMMSEASATKAPIAKIADKISGVFVPLVIAIGVITTLVWLILGESVGFSLARGISVFVISCPCALGLATPVAIMVANGVGAKNSILFKSAEVLEEMGRIEIVALDKTGTITMGSPKVTDVIAIGGIEEERLLQICYTLEYKSEHPLAIAVTEYAKEKGISLIESKDFNVLAGNGVSAQIEQKTVYGGNYKFINEKTELDEDIKALYEQLAREGKTPLFFTMDNKLIGIIAVADKVKEDSQKAITELKNMGIKVIMVTGDNEKTAKAVNKIVGADEVIYEVLPDGKKDVIEKLKKEGKTAMVGDGINDALALTQADVGIAIGAGTDVAVNAADIVLMKNRLSDVSSAVRLSRKTLKNIYENYFWAFIYNIIGIPLAAGVWIKAFGWQLNPMFGAAAMSLSSFCVVINALRLNFCNIKNPTNDKKYKTRKKREKIMEKELKISGMMCMHCEARVKNSLEELEEVVEAIVSHEKNNAIVRLSKDIDIEILKDVVKKQGYTVLD